MRVMTFNLRFENDRDGENSWSCRRKLVVEVIRRHAPSILGTQEGTQKQLDYLQERLPQYRMHAPARSLDETCQYPTLFYFADELNAISGNEFWLSKTPHLHRSKNWDSAFPRMMSFALMEERRVRRPFWAAVTHLDHIGVEARREQAGMIVDWIVKQSCPVILMGDFNALPGSPVHGILTLSAAGLQDTWQALVKTEDQQSMTHHGFNGVPQKGRIDWILVSDQFRVLDAAIVRDQLDGRYPSDHFPYLVDLDWQ
jgi:endonuclease/exonuclease/phosphatase family metal-dependent hydrolase